MTGSNLPNNDDATVPETAAGEVRGERVLQAIMFTDIEGSVGLERALGTERYARVLTRHGEL